MQCDPAAPASQATDPLAGLIPGDPAAGAALERWASQAQKLGAVAREIERDRAVAALKTAGFQSPARLVDAALVPVQGAADATDLFNEPSPWGSPVDGAALLDEMAGTFRRFVVLPDGAADALAIWSLYTHAFQNFEVAPYLVITSPTKRCGKSTVIRLLARLARRGIEVANMSTAVLFRLLDAHHPTLLLDEADAWMRGERNEEARGLMNSGHDRGARAWRCAKNPDGAIGLESYDAFGPRAIAAIGSVQSTIEDRSIIVCMRRRGAGERVEKMHGHRLAGLSELYSQAARWAVDHAADLRITDPDVPDLGSDRAEDNWRPLLAVADAAGGAWSDRARQAARALAARESDAEQVGVLLLRDMQDLFAETGTARIETTAILERLHQMDTRPWSEWGRTGRPIAGRGLACLLRPFGIEPVMWRDGGRAGLRGYSIESFADAFGRYLPSTPGAETLHPLHTEFDKGKRPIPNATGDPVCSVSTSQKDVGLPDCSGCSVSTSPLEGDGRVDARDLLAEVNRWPVARRKRWADRTLELRALRGCSLDDAEVAAARELEVAA